MLATLESARLRSEARGAIERALSRLSRVERMVVLGDLLYREVTRVAPPLTRREAVRVAVVVDRLTARAAALRVYGDAGERAQSRVRAHLSILRRERAVTARPRPEHEPARDGAR